MKPIASAGRRADPRAGFALIEMLAALSIALAILALLAQFTNQTSRNWARGESTIAAMEMLTSGLGRMRADLARALPMRPPGTDGETVMFVGSPSKLTFVAATGFGAGDRGLELISMTVAEDLEGVAVVRERGPVTTATLPLRDPVILLRGRMRVQFSYRNDQDQTVPNWVSRPHLPKAIAIDIVGPTGASVFPVPVLLSLPTNLPAICLGGDSTPGGTGGAALCPGAQQPAETTAKGE